MSNVDVSRFFDRVLQFQSIEDWCPVYDGGAFGRIDHASYRSAIVVRLQRVDRLTIEQRVAVARPEFWCSGFLPEDGNPFERRLLEHYSPGDAIAEWCTRDDMKASVMFGEMEALRTIGMLCGNTDLSRRPVMRMTVWRDFPKAGSFVMALIPVLGENEASRSQGTMAYYMSGKSIDDGRAVLTDHLMEVPWPTFPDWWTPGLKRYLELMHRHHEQLAEPEVIDRAEAIFVIACLRNCARGPPLVPFRKGDVGGQPVASSGEGAFVEIGGYLWVAAPREGFSLAAYLQCLLRFLGLDPSCAFDRLDGHRLAPYQVVMRSSQWEMVQDEFGKLFRCQQAAYRHLRGGKVAPKLRFGAKPACIGLCLEAPTIAPRFTERNTFLEWAEVSVEGPPRSAEYP